MTAVLGKDLVGLESLSPDKIRLILDTAEPFKEVSERPIKKVPALRGKTIVNLFFEASTRTRISFEFAEKRLSADTVNVSATGSSVSKGETLVDTARNLEAMRIDMVVIRHPSSGAAEFLGRRIRSNVVNAGDGKHEHPTQALLDLLTLRDKFGRIEGLKDCLVGDGLHPGPMNRGVEIDSRVADGPHSVILDQVTNGVAVRMAVLYLLAGGKPELADAAKGGSAGASD